MLIKNVNGVDVVMSAEEEAQVRAEWAANDKKQAEYEATEGYKGRRLAEYPPVQDQLNALWEAMDRGELPQVSGFYDVLKAVNDRHPKSVG